MSPNLILVVWGVIAIIYSVPSNALHFPSNALSLDKAENKIKIELIDVKCDKNENGMQVNVVFSQPFDGIIYSQGYFSDPKCRYVAAGENEKSHNFVVPFEGCGSKPSCSICDSIDNILVIQQDEEVQGEFDAARKISCSRTGLEEEKKIFFKPFIVEMLDVVTVPTAHGGVDCWMDIQRGIFPQLTAIGDTIKIGEALSVLVYLRDSKKEYDLTVRNCWAYDNEDFDDKKTGKVQLSDASGCTMKRKLLGSWKKTTQTGSSGASLLLHNTLRAFKFPDESQVYLKCDIEICRGTCAEAICDADEINKVDCTVDPFNSKCMHDKFNQDRVESTTLPLNFKPYDSTRVPNSLEKQKSTKRPLFNASPTESFGYISTTTVIDQETTTQTPFVCGLGSRDIRCRRPQNFETTQTPESTTTAFRETTTYIRDTTTLRDTTTYPNYIQSNTIKPVVDSFCDRYPSSKRCTQRITEDLGPNVEILTFRPPSPFATVKYQTTTDVPTTFLPSTTFIPYVSANCARNPNDYRCKQNEIIQTTAASQVDEQPLNCRGNNLDPRCPNPTPTNTPPTYLPPSSTQKLITPRIEVSTSPTIAITRKSTTTRQPITRQPITRQPITRQPVTKQSITKNPTKKFFICVPGSNDVNCDFEAKKEDQDSQTKELNPQDKIPTIPSRNQYTTKKPIEKPICFVGSTNPECQKVSTTIITSKPPISTAKPPQAFTTRTSSPRISPCYAGSLEPRCTKLTTNKPVFKPLSTTTNRYVASEIPVFVVQEQPNCYPGSLDPACPRSGPFTKKTVPKITSSRTTTRPATPTTPKTIYKVPSTTRTPICSAGSSDQRCLELITTKRVNPTISTTQESTSDIPSTTTFAPSSAIKSQCYFGSKDPKCTNLATTTETDAEITTASTYIPEIATYKAINTFPKAPASRCYPGTLDPQCKQSSTTTTQRTPGTILISKITTTTSTPKLTPTCYPGSLDPRCKSYEQLKCGPGNSLDPRCPITKKPTFTPFKTDSQTTTKSPVITSRVTPTTKQTTTTTTAEVLTTKEIGTTAPPRCFPGSFDPRCQQTTKKPLTPQATPKFSIVTNAQPTRPPVCYPGALDPRCRTTESTSTTTKRTPIEPIGKDLFKLSVSTTRKSTTTTQQTPTILVDLRQDINEIEGSSTQKSTQCYPNSFDPKCRQSLTTTTTTARPTAAFSLRQELNKAPSSTTFKPIPSITSTTAPKCYLGSLDPRCRQSSTTTTQRTPSSRLISKISTTTGIPKLAPTCYPGSLDPRCKSFGQLKCGPGIPLDPRCPNPTPTAEPATYLPPFNEISYKTTKPPISVSTADSQVLCASNSLDPRCKTTSTTKPTPSTYTKGTTTTSTYTPKFTTKSPPIPIVSTTSQPSLRSTTSTTIKPSTYTTQAFSTTTRRPFTTFTTRRIFSSPQPFVTRQPSVSTTTENILCYPGSPIQGCKPTDVVTPSFCYPGSTDKRF